MFIYHVFKDGPFASATYKTNEWIIDMRLSIPFRSQGRRYYLRAEITILVASRVQVLFYVDSFIGTALGWEELIGEWSVHTVGVVTWVR